MKILLPIDNSPESTHALEAVGRGTWPSDAEILVLAVAPRHFLPPPPPSMLEVLEGGWRGRSDETTRARVWVQLAVEALKSSGLAAHGKVRRGHPATEIAEEARAWGADSIVLGAPDGVSPRHVLAGEDLASSVAARAPCSVEVIGEEPTTASHQAAPKVRGRQATLMHPST
jgi:nucleotide-binding universal stress UspA family protein